MPKYVNKCSINEHYIENFYLTKIFQKILNIK